MCQPFALSRKTERRRENAGARARGGETTRRIAAGRRRQCAAGLSLHCAAGGSRPGVRRDARASERSMRANTHFGDLVEGARGARSNYTGVWCGLSCG